MPDANSQRRERQQFKRHDRIGEGLGAEEDVRSRKMRVVAGAAAGELIFAECRDGELFDQTRRRDPQARRS